MSDRYSRWLAAAIIGLLASGTIAAKTVFLVDNELETQAESTIEYWQPDLKSARIYTDRLKKFTTDLYRSACARRDPQHRRDPKPDPHWCG